MILWLSHIIWEMFSNMALEWSHHIWECIVKWLRNDLKLFEKLFSITDINPKNSISIASYAKKYVDKVSGYENRYSDPIVR